MSAAWIIAARRSAVVPRNGAFRSLGVQHLAAPVIEALLRDTHLSPAAIDDVVFGNAQYGGGNPARLIALSAGLPESVPATTIDTQCCSGLDAIIMATERIAAGAADIVIAGGVESWSRAPIRSLPPLEDEHAPVAYRRPPFTPWPDRDPDMTEAAHRQARLVNLPRNRQEAFAIDSHRKALDARACADAEIVSINGIDADVFTRRLTQALCERLPALSVDDAFALTASTIAVEADAAAATLVVSDAALKRLRPPAALRIVAGIRCGGDPTLPSAMTTHAVRRALSRTGLAATDMAAFEIMEAFAAQALASVEALGFDPARVNIGGGALARGHPTGASGAILAVRLFHEMKAMRSGAKGLATIAAAGGLGTAVIVEKAAMD